MSDAPAKTAVFTCEVIRVMPFGLLVRLEDGRTAIIRERELAWTAEERRNWRQTYRPGVHVRAVMLDERGGESPELSLRLAQSDPWLTLTDWLQPGQLVNGVVTAVQLYGVFIELQPGVTGLLHQSNLPIWCRRSIGDVFWPGDDVKVVVQHIDLQQRHIALTMRDIRLVRWSGDVRQNGKARAESQSGLSAPRAQPSLLPMALASLPRPYTILLVDNDGEYRDTWVRWLRNAGQHVAAVATAEDALERLDGGDTFDLVLMDVHLPGMSGAEALTRILERAPEARGVLMSGDWAYFQRRDPALERLQSAGALFLPKPFQAEDLLNLLLSLSPADQAAGADSAEKASARPVPKPTSDYVGPQRLLEQAFLRAQRLTRASLAVLFKLDPSSRRVEIELPRDDERFALEALLNLIHSPVRDVAEDRAFCSVEDTEAALGKVRYLLPLLRFRACLGAPVPVDSTDRYALFFFYERPTVFGEVQREQARAGALAVGAALERREMVARIVEGQRDILLGQLNRGLVHELNNRIPAADNSLISLKKLLERVERALGVSPESAPTVLREMREALGETAENVASLTRVNELFKRFTTQSSVSVVWVEHVAREAVEMARDMAEGAGVDIEVEAPAGMVIVRANPIHLQHVLLNVMLNAIQQIALLRPRKAGHEGRVCIRIEERQRRIGPVVLISIEDDGPGIHRRHRQHIFDLGFTTRSDGGSGLGLYVAQHLMEAMHGRIYVAESAMLWGTRFVLELPGGV